MHYKIPLHLAVWLKQKIITENSGDDAKKLDHSSIAGKNVNRYSYPENGLKVP